MLGNQGWAQHLVCRSEVKAPMQTEGLPLALARVPGLPAGTGRTRGCGRHQRGRGHCRAKGRDRHRPGHDLDLRAGDAQAIDLLIGLLKTLGQIGQRCSVQLRHVRRRQRDPQFMPLAGVAQFSQTGHLQRRTTGGWRHNGLCLGFHVTQPLKHQAG